MRKGCAERFHPRQVGQRYFGAVQMPSGRVARGAGPAQLPVGHSPGTDLVLPRYTVKIRI